MLPLGSSDMIAPTRQNHVGSLKLRPHTWENMMEKASCLASHLIKLKWGRSKHRAVTNLSGSSISQRWFLRHAWRACDYSHVWHHNIFIQFFCFSSWVIACLYLSLQGCQMGLSSHDNDQRISSEVNAQSLGS
jgi:hypothetical protein